MTREEARAEIEKLDLLILGVGGVLCDRDADDVLLHPKPASYVR
jgi:hypothetical protein